MHQPFEDDAEFRAAREDYFRKLAAFWSNVMEEKLAPYDAQQISRTLKEEQKRLDWYEEYNYIHFGVPRTLHVYRDALKSNFPSGVTEHLFKTGCSCRSCSKHTTITMQDAKLLKEMKILWNERKK
jgi:hypothetical protein